MNLFALNLMLAMLWCALTGSFMTANILTGFVLSFATLWLTSTAIGSRSTSTYFRKTLRGIVFVAWFFRELVISNFRVLRAVITPGISYHPGTFALPLDCESDMEITMLANLITLTPGTLSVDVSENRKILYVHTMFAEDPEGVIREIKNGLERRLLELSR